MRCAIIADIHANLEAFQAVLDDIERRGGVGKFWCLGDIIGYGPDPSECVSRLRQLDNICVAGNHDLAAIGKVGTEEFNPDAAAACRWTSHQLNPDDIDYLASLPLVLEERDFTLAHGSPRDPIWEYVLSVSLAQENFTAFKTQFCLVGHSHVPLVFQNTEGGNCSGRIFLSDEPITIGKERLIINPGGVGQPRDRDPRTSYAIYDSDSMMITLYRVPYDIRATQEKILAAGLPVSLATRLGYGI